MNKTFGVKLNDGKIIKVRAPHFLGAEVKVGIGKCHSIWEIGKIWDEKGCQK